VKQMVELHGGRVGVESEPGKGATFCLELPKQADGQ
jgi:signal transduction histidine kinase